jgi:hypothetical protein
VNASPFRTMLTGLESSFQTPAIDGKAAGFSGGRVTNGGAWGPVSLGTVFAAPASCCLASRDRWRPPFGRARRRPRRHGR